MVLWKWMILVENFVECLGHIREMKGQASSRTIMNNFNTSMENANELDLRLTSVGLNIITNLK